NLASWKVADQCLLGKAKATGAASPAGGSGLRREGTELGLGPLSGVRSGFWRAPRTWDDMLAARDRRAGGVDHRRSPILRRGDASDARSAPHRASAQLGFRATDPVPPAARLHRPRQ